MSACSETNASLPTARSSDPFPAWKAYAPWWVAAFLAGSLMVVAGCGGAEREAASEGEAQMALGLQVYRSACITCHQADGNGISGVYPPLHSNAWVEGDAGRLVRLLLDGMEGEVEVGGQVYDQRMVSHDHLTDEKIAAVLTFVRQSFGNDAPAVTAGEVARVRAADERETFWTADELWAATGIPADTAAAGAAATP